MVGDTPYDALAVREAHVAMIAVTSGGWPAEQLSGAAGVYTGPGELARVFPF
jgi:phosphoglycolate phosphatase-like HAD superfamily hydrolase